MKELSLFFGSDMYASGITLAAFMGGLALGAYIAGLFVDKIKQHILVYGILEISIGIYALLFRPVLDLFDPSLAKAYAVFYDNASGVYHGLRFAIALLLLVIPTAFMGATLPVILKAFTKKTNEIGQITGHFYAINTFGALAGVFVSGFVLLPSIGLHDTNLFAAGLNLVLGSVSMALARSNILSQPERFEIAGEAEKAELKIAPDLRSAALIAAAVSGFAGLGLEVVWTRILVQSFSATVYSFSMMLVAFLLGIAIGSKAIESRLNTSVHALRLLSKIQLLGGFSVALLACLTFLIPQLFGILVWGLSAISPRLFGFASVFGALFVSSLFILPTTILLGASFPAALKAYNDSLKSTGRDSGFILFVNTICSVAGALLTGFILLPAIGSLNSLLFFASVFLLNGVFIYRKVPGVLFKKITVPVCMIIFFMIVGFFVPRHIVLNYNMQQNKKPQVIYHSEGIMGYIDVIRNQKNETILSINGNIEADNSPTQLRHFVLKAHLPLMFAPNPKRVLVVGLGLGITTSCLLKHPEIERVDVIELSPDIVKAQEHLKDVNEDVLSDKRIHLKIDDGRNYLKFTHEKYDMITADPIHPRISGVGVLYTEEYYRLIRERLNENGAALQWMPVYSISPESYEIAVRTMAKVFPNTSVWYVHGHTLLLGMKSESEAVPDYTTITRNFNVLKIREDLNRIGIHEPLDLLKLQILSSVELKARLADNNKGKINSENLPYLEYQTPFEYLRKTEDVLTWLNKYRGKPEPSVSNSPAGFLEKLSIEQKTYRDSIR